MGSKITTLSRFERLLLANQFKIMKALNAEDKETCERNIEILENGYTLDYEDPVFLNIFEEMPIDECKRVNHILAMASCIYRAYDRMSEEEIDSIGGLWKFLGFDGNNETNQMIYCEYIIETENRFADLKREPNHDWDSHYPTRDAYDRMLEVWEHFDTKQQHNLSTEDLKAILDARMRK